LPNPLRQVSKYRLDEPGQTTVERIAKAWETAATEVIGRLEARCQGVLERPEVLEGAKEIIQSFLDSLKDRVWNQSSSDGKVALLDCCACLRRYRSVTGSQREAGGQLPWPGVLIS
jgi:hypothetical protein